MKYILDCHKIINNKEMIKKTELYHHVKSFLPHWYEMRCKLLEETNVCDKRLKIVTFITNIRKNILVYGVLV